MRVERVSRPTSDDGPREMPRAAGRVRTRRRRSPSPPPCDTHGAMHYNQDNQPSPALLHRCPFSNCYHASASMHRQMTYGRSNAAPPHDQHPNYTLNEPTADPHPHYTLNIPSADTHPHNTLNIPTADSHPHYTLNVPTSDQHYTLNIPSADTHQHYTLNIPSAESHPNYNPCAYTGVRENLYSHSTSTCSASSSVESSLPTCNNLPLLHPTSDNLQGLLPMSDNLPLLHPTTDNLPRPHPTSSHSPAELPSYTGRSMVGEDELAGRVSWLSHNPHQDSHCDTNMRNKGVGVMLNSILRLVDMPNTHIKDETQKQLEQKIHSLEMQIYEETKSKTEKEYLTLIVMKLAAVLYELRRIQAIPSNACPDVSQTLYSSSYSHTRPPSPHVA